MYVDDALVGGHTLSQAQDARKQLIGILETACMKLDKWSSNHATLLPADSTATSRFFAETNTVSVLGLLWSPSHNCFTFKVTLGPLPRTFTKRLVLSEVARLFDPLGWLSPVIVVGKLLIQQLWLNKNHKTKRTIDVTVLYLGQIGACAGSRTPMDIMAGGH